MAASLWQTAGLGYRMVQRLLLTYALAWDLTSLLSYFPSQRHNLPPSNGLTHWNHVTALGSRCRVCVCVRISGRLLGSGLCWGAGGWLLRHLLHWGAWVNIKDALGDHGAPGTHTNKTEVHASVQTHMLFVYSCKDAPTHTQIQTAP